mmetsp:Transcript_24112/g.46704  ORF Transcript_24112/g.46704 Transcript_24112/m.46704 type:complete len:212 (+) Transcript_24112:187-822(+)
MRALRRPSDHRRPQGAPPPPPGGGEKAHHRRQQRTAREEARAGHRTVASGRLDQRSRTSQDVWTPQDVSLPRHRRCRTDRHYAHSRVGDRRRGDMAAGARGGLRRGRRVLPRRPRGGLRAAGTARYRRLLWLLLWDEHSGRRSGGCAGGGARGGRRSDPVNARRDELALPEGVRRPPGRCCHALCSREHRCDAVAAAGGAAVPAGACGCCC